MPEKARRGSSPVTPPETAPERWRRRRPQRSRQTFAGRGGHHLEGTPTRPGSRGSYRPARTARPAARRPTSAPCHPRPGQRPRPATPAPARPVPSRPAAGSHGRRAWPCRGGEGSDRRGGAAPGEGADSAPAPPAAHRKEPGGECLRAAAGDPGAGGGRVSELVGAVRAPLPSPTRPDG